MKKAGDQLSNSEDIIASARKVLKLEAAAVLGLEKYIDDIFVSVVKAVLNCKGKLVFTGIGKAGIIAKKVASTFSSLGRHSFFMHSAEASHGDLGMVHQSDLVFLFSNSGNSKEVTSLIPTIKKIGCKTIAITGRKESYLYREVDYPLFVGELEEACGLGLAPTTSTMAMLGLGDALSVAVLKQDYDFDERKFAFYHPGGSLGKKLMYVKELMRKSDEVVWVSEDVKVNEVLLKMTQARIGTAVVTANRQVVGVFSDGDLRRGLEQDGILEYPIKEVMTKAPIVVVESDYVMNALELLTTKKIGELPVINTNAELVGVICLKDLV